jgi:hypothetical protein
MWFALREPLLSFNVRKDVQRGLRSLCRGKMRQHLQAQRMRHALFRTLFACPMLEAMRKAA